MSSISTPGGIPAPRSPARLKLTLYSRAYCHLCQDMLAALEALRSDFDFDIELFDVDSDPELERRFNELVPVLMHDGHELARWRLDVTAFRAYLADIG